MNFHIQLTRHLTPADQAAGPYVYLPFRLPQPARRLHVAYRYSAAISSDQVHGGNVIDIGLFDPRGHDFPGGAGFRGWSGSARQEFTIGLEEATPGYLPGPLPPGEYQIILGLYRIWEAGAHVDVHVQAELDPTLDATAPAPPSLAPRRLPPLPAPTWLRGDLQSHTVHSDARGTLEQLVARARDLGLDFLAITDHNTVSHHPFLPTLADERLILIPGQEVTTYRGHMNVWGTSRWCDFRCRTDQEMAAVIRLAHAHGGVCSINHPKTGGPPWEYSTDLPVQAMEVWQGPWPHHNAESLALWDRLLAAGRRLPAVGGSDYHCPADKETNFLRLGQPTTWVQVDEPDVAGILSAIVAGRSCISATPDGPRLDLRGEAGGQVAVMGQSLPGQGGEAPVHFTVEVWGGQGRTLRLVADGRPALEQPIRQERAIVHASLPVARYMRAEVVGDMDPALLPVDAPPVDLRGWRWALSNPIYITGA
ncbi:MAG: phosphoesterase [Litorilinea sp.]|nr:MAG: phosphoesterase [Litorilinea sp.]